jgi:uracil-DNA glycosylase
MSPLERFVQKIRSEQGLSTEVPGFDPLNGNENARFLFVLEAPGPKAVKKTGVISFDNPDQTARVGRNNQRALRRMCLF